jgi:hypothetical protein
MNETIERMIPLVVATVVGWLCVAVVALLNLHAFVTGAAAIVAIIATVSIWSMWALDQYGISVDGTPHEREYEKNKRDDAGSSSDARVALLLALLTPDEREGLKTRLADELRSDGEAVTLAELLAAPEADAAHTERSS